LGFGGGGEKWILQLHLSSFILIHLIRGKGGVKFHHMGPALVYPFHYLFIFKNLWGKSSCFKNKPNNTIIREILFQRRHGAFAFGAPSKKNNRATVQQNLRLLGRDLPLTLGLPNLFCYFWVVSWLDLSGVPMIWGEKNLHQETKPPRCQGFKTFFCPPRTPPNCTGGGGKKWKFPGKPPPTKQPKQGPTVPGYYRKWGASATIFPSSPDVFFPGWGYLRGGKKTNLKVGFF